MSDSVPDPRLEFDPEALQMTELPRLFYLRPTAAVARALLGTWIARRHQRKWYGGCIVETEAYLGSRDAAAHSWRGRRTNRVEPMYMAGGHLYVFFVYGMHYCANVVTRPAGVPEAVLLRAAIGPAGAPAKLMSGPGRLCAALGIRTCHSGTDLLAEGDLRIFCPPYRKRSHIVISPRIGVEYSGDARHWPLRFYDLASPAVSGPARFRSPDMRRRKP